MGNPAQERIVRKLDLELFLSQVAPHPSPNASLEQYTISEGAAATMLYLSAYTYGDIIGKRVLDLACGTGRLALGAAFLGAKHVVGVDIDRAAVRCASQNSRNTGFADAVQWVMGDVGAVVGRFDTVLQNPPFGVQKRGADRRFLEKALEVGNVIYSLHNHPKTDKQLVKRLKSSGENLLQVPPSPFIENFVEERDGEVRAVYAILMTIPRMFDFHTKTKHEIVVDIYVIRTSA